MSGKYKHQRDMLAVALVLVIASFSIYSVLISAGEDARYAPDLRHPSLSQLQAFLSDDETDSISPSTSGWDCDDYATALRSNAKEKGLDLDIVLLEFDYAVPELNLPFIPRPVGHALNGCELSDGSYVIIEPQTDKVMDWVGVGDNYEIGENSFAIIDVTVIE